MYEKLDLREAQRIGLSAVIRGSPHLFSLQRSPGSMVGRVR